MKRLAQALFAMAVFTGVLAAGASSARAQADYYGYPCEVAFVPFDWGHGTSGYVSMFMYSGPHCTGTYQKYAYVCSKGAPFGSTSSACWAQYSDPALFAIMQSLNKAALDGQQVHVVAYSTGEVAYVNFR